MQVNVSYNTLLPNEFERRLKECPIAYIPFGSLEWHSAHLPFGVDTMRAEAILERVAQAYGGIVLPGIPWGAMHGSWRMGTHPGLSQQTRDAFYTEVYQGLVEVGFKVLVGVSGHWTSKQTESIRQALRVVCQDGQVAGFATFDGCDEFDGFDYDPDLTMDHAGARETSAFMFLYPEHVELERLEGWDLSDLPGEECHLTRSGIQGRNPLIYADPELGRRHVDRIVQLIGERAQEEWRRLRERTR